MNPSTNPILQRAAKAVRRLIQECRKDGPLYRTNVRAAAQVNRTGKWLLNALAQLDQQPQSSTQEEEACSQRNSYRTTSMPRSVGCG